MVEGKPYFMFLSLENAHLDFAESRRRIYNFIQKARKFGEPLTTYHDLDYSCFDNSIYFLLKAIITLPFLTYLAYRALDTH